MQDFTPMQSRFMDEFIRTLDPSKAASQAGYAKNDAKKRALELLRNPKILAEIDRRIDAQAHAFRISDAFIIKNLLKITDSALAAETVFDKNGETLGTRLRDPAVALRALDLLAKCYTRVTPENSTPDGVKLMFIENLDEKKI